MFFWIPRPDFDIKKGKLIYFPESGKSKTYHQFKGVEIQSQFPQRIDLTERIQEIFMYKTPLSQNQFTFVVFNHQFIVFETQNWWWSIQKKDDQIILQRSKLNYHVREYHSRSKRCQKTYWEPKEIKRSKGQLTLEHLVEWMTKTENLEKGYDWLSFNDTKFANKFFDQFKKK